MRRDDLSLPPPPKVERPGAPYRCGRGPGQRPCEDGPDRRGRCPLAVAATEPSAAERDRPCRPNASWAMKRRRWVTGFLLVFSALLTIGLGTPAAPKIVQPGPLSKPHSQILAGTLTGERCSACHDNVSTDAWFGIAQQGHSAVRLADSAASTHTRTTDLCLRCHHDQIAPATARMAHNLLPETRNRLRSSVENAEAPSSRTTFASTSSNRSGDNGRWGGPMVGQDSLECGVCHQEHHGADADLTRIADARCQTCHQTQFGSFADSHPEFRVRGSRLTVGIDFDHVRHANLHFPQHFGGRSSHDAGKVSKTHAADGRPADQDGMIDHDPRQAVFDCRGCHESSTGGSLSPADPVVATLPYEIACAACHNDSLKTQLNRGPALVSLPMLPPDAVDQLPSWPTGATGLPDGRFSLLSRMLLVDPEATSKQVPRKLPDLLELSTLDWADPVTQQQVTRSADQTRQFAIRLAREGQPALLQLARQAGWNESDAITLARSFPPQVLRDALPAWFTTAAEEHAVVQEMATTGNGDSGTVRKQIPDAPPTLGESSEAREESSINSAIALPGPKRADPLKERVSLDIDMPELIPNSSSPTGSHRDDGGESNNLGGGILEGGNGLLGSDSDALADPLAEGLTATGDPADPLATFEAVDRDTKFPSSGASSSYRGSEPKDDPMASLRQRFDAARSQPLGGWVRDDLTLSLRYRGSGHADPVLTGILNTISRLPPRDPLRTQWLQEPWVGACVQCHSRVMKDPVAGGDLLTATHRRSSDDDPREFSGNVDKWRSRPPEADADQLHRFSHRPHLNIRGLSDCSHCHSLLTRPGNPLAQPDTGAASASHSPERPTPGRDDFRPLQKAMCVTCHTPAGAGAHCTQCHRYHTAPKRRPQPIKDEGHITEPSAVTARAIEVPPADKRR